MGKIDSIETWKGSPHRPPEVRGAVAEGDWGDVLSYKSKMS